MLNGRFSGIDYDDDIYEACYITGNVTVYNTTGNLILTGDKRVRKRRNGMGGYDWTTTANPSDKITLINKGNSYTIGRKKNYESFTQTFSASLIK